MSSFSNISIPIGPQKVDDSSPLITYSCPANSSVSALDESLALPLKNSSTASNTMATTSSDPSSTGWTSDSTLHTTTGACTATFSFVGTQVQASGSSNYDHGVYGCSIDNGNPVWFNGWRGSATQEINLCSIDGLSSANHTLTLTNGPMTDWLLTLDYITYTNDLSISNSSGSFQSANPVYDLSTTVYKPIPSATAAWQPYTVGHVVLGVLSFLEFVGVFYIHCLSRCHPKSWKKSAASGSPKEKSLKKGGRNRKKPANNESSGESSSD